MPKSRVGYLLVFSMHQAIFAQTPESTAAARLPGRTKGLNFMLSALTAPQTKLRPSGFLLGIALERPFGEDGDGNLGMSYLRLSGFDAPVTVVSLADLTVSQRGATALLGGVGVGTVAAQGQTRFGARLFAGAEFFHRHAVPISLVFELILKFCDDGPQEHVCPEKEQQTWVAGRIGIRL